VTARRAVLLAAAATALTACLAGASPTQQPSFDHLREVQVEVAADGHRHRFRAWVAETPQARTQGLMFVRDLPADRGMLFLFEELRFASFWMKNTYIPLDLLFVAADGTIVNIIEQATPHSPELLESIAPVTSVLELAGGTTARLGIRAGDRLQVLQAPAAVTR